jgi:hypothetical protein
MIAGGSLQGGHMAGASAALGGAAVQAAEAGALTRALERSCRHFLEDCCTCLSTETEPAAESDAAVRSLCGGAGDGAGSDGLRGGARGAELVRLHASLLGATLRLRGADDAACAAEGEELLLQALRTFCGWLVIVNPESAPQLGGQPTQGQMLARLDRGEISALQTLLAALHTFVGSGALAALGAAIWAIVSPPRGQRHMSPHKHRDTEGVKFALLHLGQLLRQWAMACLGATEMSSPVMRVIGALSGE